jgi:hypothetical protein
MLYVVSMKIDGYSYIDAPRFIFEDKLEALDFAETAKYRAGEGVLSSVSIDIVREEADA